MSARPLRDGRRLALVANPSADLYGSDRMALETVRGLRAAGWEVVVSACETGPLATPLRAAGAHLAVCPAPVVRKGNLSPRGAVRLVSDVVRGLWPMVQTVRRTRPDVLYVSTVTIPLWLVVARLLGVPAVLHVHEAEASVHPLARAGLALPARLARRVIFNSETSRAVAGRWSAPADRVRVIPNGVAGPATVRPPRDHVDAPRLVYVGRLSPRKGVDVAIEALAVLRSRGVDAHLDIVGNVFPGYEWYERQLRDRVASLGLSGAIAFHGFTDDVWPYLAGGDVVLIPSRADESFGNGVIEAALSARPSVVSDHTGLREAAACLRSAARVPHDDPPAVADAVEELLSRWPVTRRLAAEDARRAADVYAPARYRRLVCDVFEDLLAKA